VLSSCRVSERRKKDAIETVVGEHGRVPWGDDCNDSPSFRLPAPPEPSLGFDLNRVCSNGALDSVSLVVFLLSANSNRSRPCQRELERATSKNLRVIAVRLENIKLSRGNIKLSRGLEFLSGWR
jgi:hypothetical protein